MENGSVNIQGGKVTGGNVLGGSGNSWLYGVDTYGGTVNIYGGDITAGTDLGGSSQNNFLVGIIAWGGTINIYGGSISGGSVSGANHFSPVDISADGGTINIAGSSFNYSYGPITSQSGTLTGTLADGTPVDWVFSIALGSAGGIDLIPVPEPGTAALSMLALFGVAGGAALRHRRRMNLLSSLPE